MPFGLLKQIHDRGRFFASGPVDLELSFR